MEITFGLALIAGLISFISPCVLPLVPAYIGYMGGRMTHDVATNLREKPRSSVSSAQMRLSTFAHGVFFVLGFTLVFVSIGLLSTAFIQHVGGSNIRVVTDLVGRIGGLLIILFGLHFMGAMPAVMRWTRARPTLVDHVAALVLGGLVVSSVVFWSLTGQVDIWNSALWVTAPLVPLACLAAVALFWLWLVYENAFTSPGPFIFRQMDHVETVLYSDTRRPLGAVAGGRSGYAGSLAMGAVFSAGWTPCIGPIYGAVLTMAANGGEVGRAAVLLGAYSIGLGIPFLLTALMLDGAQLWLRRLQSRMRAIELTSGLFLVVIGVAVASGQLQGLSQQFAGEFAEVSIAVEQQVIGMVTGDTVTGSGPVAENSSAQPADVRREVGLEVGAMAPDFTAVTDSGEPISLSSLRGNVVLLNFWATWCGPCRIEMPHIQAVFERAGDQNFVVLAVNNAESGEAVTRFREAMNLTFPIALDERAEIQRQYGVLSYPSTFLIDRDGTIVARHLGAMTADQIEPFVAAAGES